MFQYIIYTLKIESSIKLGFLPIHGFSEKPDVTILSQKVRKPRKNLRGYLYKPYTIYNENNFYLEVEDICKFLIKGDDKLYIQKNKKSEWKDVTAFFFDSILSILLIKHDIFLFHASALKIKNKGYLFCAPSGVGKSTLALHFMQNSKARIIEDDKVLLRFNEKKNKFEIRNHFPFMELWRPQAKKISSEKKVKGIGKVRSNIQKFRFDISELLPKRPVVLDKIILLELSNTQNTIAKKQLKGLNKVNVAVNFTHNVHHIYPLKKNKTHFQHVADVVNGTEVWHVNRSRIAELEDVIKYIEDELID